MARVRLTESTTMAGPEGVWHGGQVLELPEEAALALVAGGWAVMEPERRSVKVEVATAAEVERAVAEDGRKRVRRKAS